jgi:alpha-glucoside transport system permease protein
MDKALNGLIAILIGVGGAVLLFWVLNFLVERLPAKWEDRLKPYVFVGPALAFIGVIVLYPLVRTLIYAFYDATGDEWVGFENFSDLLGSFDFRETLFNNLLWLLFVPAGIVIAGLAVAVLADRLQPRSEKIAKSIVFVPLAISFVGAATIWRFVYESRPAGQPQIGLLNSVVTSLGFDPIAWIQKDEFHLNTFLLMVVVLWLQAGFAMVLLSAAIKGVPQEIIEASRVDGATERQIFVRVLMPSIWPTVVTVMIIEIVLVLKVFDVVYVMTGGNFNTDVVGNRIFIELFQFGDSGRSAAMVVLLLIAVIPPMIYQVRQFRAQEAAR